MLINLLSSSQLERKKWVEKLAAAKGKRVENQIFQQLAGLVDCCQLEKKKKC